MGRNIAGVIVGYIGMVAVVFIGLTLLYTALGPDKIYLADSFQVSTTWILTSLFVGFIAALVGGKICFAISKTQLSLYWLAGIVLIVGIVMAYPTLGIDPPTETRTAELTSTEAMIQGWQPAWVAFANPIVGVLGVLAVIGPRKKSEQN